MALVSANPAGSPVLLGNLYTAVWEGHAFLYMYIHVLVFLILWVVI